MLSDHFPDPSARLNAVPLCTASKNPDSETLNHVHTHTNFPGRFGRVYPAGEPLTTPYSWVNMNAERFCSMFPVAGSSRRPGAVKEVVLQQIGSMRIRTFRRPTGEAEEPHQLCDLTPSWGTQLPFRRV